MLLWILYSFHKHKKKEYPKQKILKKRKLKNELKWIEGRSTASNMVKYGPYIARVLPYSDFGVIFQRFLLTNTALNKKECRPYIISTPRRSSKRTNCLYYTLFCTVNWDLYSLEKEKGLLWILNCTDSKYCNQQ